jgi:hypothetical protein
VKDPNIIFSCMLVIESSLSTVKASKVRCSFFNSKFTLFLSF